MRTTTRDRQERVLAELMKRRHVSVSELAADLDVSESTVRRDLQSLASRRQAELIHGGATLPGTADFSFQAKAGRNIRSKSRIGRLAASLVSQGDCIFLDSGTTTYEMLPHLVHITGLSVIASSARLALDFRSTDARVVLLGGQYRADRMDCVGPIAMNTLDQLRGYTAFIGADGLARDFGPAASDIESSHLYRAASEHADRTALLVDHTKFERTSLFKIVGWKHIDIVITDHAPPQDWIDFFAERDIELMLPTDHSNDDAADHTDAHDNQPINNRTNGSAH